MVILAMITKGRLNETNQPQMLRLTTLSSNLSLLIYDTFLFVIYTFFTVNNLNVER